MKNFLKSNVQWGTVCALLIIACLLGFDSVQSTYPQYNASPPTFTSGFSSVLQTDVNGNLKVNTGGTSVTIQPFRGTATTTNPTIASGSSVQVLAANANRKYLNIQNNAAFNEVVSWNGGTLTGATPTSGNPCMILYANGGGYEWPASFVPTSAITVYQASGPSTNLVSVTEGQ